MEIQDIIQGLTQAEITAITSPDERSLIVNTTLQQAVIYVNGTFKQASFEDTDDIPEGTNKFATIADLAAIAVNTAKVSFPEAPIDGKQYARKDAAWEEVAASGTSEPLHIIVLNSTDDTQVFNRASPYTIEWDLEKEKDSAFTHSNTTNNSIIEINDSSTYSFAGNIRIFNGTDQRTQPTVKLIIDGTLQDWNLASGYIRNAGNASDFWTFDFNFQPVKLNSGQEIEIQISHETSNPSTWDSTFIGSESYFWGVKLQGTKGEKGDTGTGSNIVVKKDGVTIGTLTDAIDILGGVPVVDEGGNVTSIEIGNYAHSTGITQMPSSQITRYTETGGGAVEIDNYDLGTSNVHFINPDAHDRDFTGMVAPSAGVNRIVTIINSGTNKKLKFKDNDSASSASNRMLLADTSDFDLAKGASAQFIYNHDVNRWTTYSYY
tara:strand:+ start:8191 stop:9492 length:1302 start_codon:yes stop_codon:yes gene_type:complete